VVKHIRVWIQKLINYNENQKMKNQDTDCRCVSQSFKVKKGTEALCHLVKKTSFRNSELQSFKIKEGTKALRHKVKK